LIIYIFFIVYINNIYLIVFIYINDKQDKKYQSEILMNGNKIDLRIAIEAGSEAGWWK
jgi:hypothetical protein